METSNIIIARPDCERLRKLINESRKSRTEDESTLRTLEAELDRATIVDSGQVPDNIVTMNSTVRVQMSGRTNTSRRDSSQTWTIVYPEEADVEENRISILAPLGTALIGYRVGDSFEWEVPAGRRRYKVIRIMHKPESTRSRSEEFST